MVCSSQARSDRLAELLVRVSAGDTRAFAELHMLTRSRLRRTAIVLGAPLGDVEDILQETYLKIWRKSDRFDSRRGSAATWISAIARHTAIDHLRAKKLPAHEFDEAFLISAAEAPEADDFDYDGAEPVALAALARLPEDRRRLVALAYLEGESRASLSQRFGVPVGTIKTWLHRAIQAVRKDCLAASTAA